MWFFSRSHVQCNLILCRTVTVSIFFFHSFEYIDLEKIRNWRKSVVTHHSYLRTFEKNFLSKFSRSQSTTYGVENRLVESTNSENKLTFMHTIHLKQKYLNTQFSAHKWWCIPTQNDRIPVKSFKCIKLCKCIVIKMEHGVYGCQVLNDTYFCLIRVDEKHTCVSIYLYLYINNKMLTSFPAFSLIHSTNL